MSVPARVLAAAALATLVLAGCSDGGTSINDQMRQGERRYQR